MPPAARTSHSPPSHDDDDLEHTGTGIHSRSRNARAQARHRAKRKAYIENLESSVKRLQAIVDANGLDPNSAPPPPPPHSHGVSHHHPYAIHELQEANNRLRREAEAMRVQLNALNAHIASGGSTSSHAPMHFHPSPPGSETNTPPPGSDRDHKKRKMSVERDHANLYLDHPQGRASPASTSTSSMHTTLASPSLANSSHSSLAQSMLSPSSLALAQQQAAYNSLFASLGSTGSTSSLPSTQSHISSTPSHLQSSQSHGRTGTPPVPVSTFANLPSSSLLASSLYPLLTLGIAGGAVSGELGAAAWNAFQQSQLAQSQSSSNGHHAHSNYLSQSQPMSTLSSTLDSSRGSPSGLQHSMESMRTSSPRPNGTNRASGGNAFGPSSSSSPRFESNMPFDTRYEPSSSRYTSHFDAPSRFDSFTTSSPQFTSAPAPTTSTPPSFHSAGSTPPGSGLGHGRRGSSSAGSVRGEVR